MNKNSKLTGKSAAAIICFCLAAVAALGIFSYNNSANELKSELSGVKDNTAETSQTVTESAEQANIPADNVPVTEAQATVTEASTVTEEKPKDTKVYSGIDGAFVRPVNGQIINDFSDGELVKSRTLNVWKTHDGVDIAAQPDEIVKSAADGTVTSITEDPLMGVTVIIDHGSGYEGIYSNLSHELEVSVNDKVNAGTTIGKVGTTAESEISEEPHLHFGLKKNGMWTDPADILSGEGS